MEHQQQLRVDHKMVDGQKKNKNNKADGCVFLNQKMWLDGVGALRLVEES